MINKNNKSVKVSDFLGLPVNLLNNLPQIELNGNIEMIIDGINEILEYDANAITVSAGSIKLYIVGTDLQIRYITERITGVCGSIHSVEFIEI